MTHLIDKDALVAEIDKLYQQHSSKEYIDEAGCVLYKLEDIINSLGVKEVDLDEYNKVKNVLSLSFMQFLDSHRQESKMCLSNGECFDIDKAFDELDFAKLFRYMEKYLKAQKGE